MRFGRLASAAAVAALAACGGSSASTPSPAPTPAATRDGRWIQDLDYLASELPRLHANLFFHVSRADSSRRWRR